MKIKAKIDFGPFCCNGATLFTHQNGAKSSVALK